MNTTLLLCQCDSLVSKISGAAIPVIQISSEAETNCQDVKIAQTICGSIVLIVAICVVGFLVWRLLDYFANMIAGYYRRGCECKDMDIKKRNAILEKLLDFLKSQTDVKEEDGKIVGVKAFKSDECTAYLNALCELIDSWPDKIIEDKLKTALKITENASSSPSESENGSN